MGWIGFGKLETEPIQRFNEVLDRISRANLRPLDLLPAKRLLNSSSPICE